MEGPYYATTLADADKLQRAFTYHPPQADQAPRYVTLRDAGHALAQVMTQLCPPSRELSLALTNLEQAIFWANAAIARNE